MINRLLNFFIDINNMIKEMYEIIISIIIGALGSLLATCVLRIKISFLEYIPRNLSILTIISSFQTFYANSPVDTYENVLWIGIRNSGAQVLYISRCIYFRNKKKNPYLCECFKIRKVQKWI